MRTASSNAPAGRIGIPPHLGVPAASHRYSRFVVDRIGVGGRAIAGRAGSVQCSARSCFRWSWCEPWHTTASLPPDHLGVVSDSFPFVQSCRSPLTDGAHPGDGPSVQSPAACSLPARPPRSAAGRVHTACQRRTSRLVVDAGRVPAGVLSDPVMTALRLRCKIGKLRERDACQSS